MSKTNVLLEITDTGFRRFDMLGRLAIIIVCFTSLITTLAVLYHVGTPESEINKLASSTRIIFVLLFLWAIAPVMLRLTALAKEQRAKR